MSYTATVFLWQFQQFRFRIQPPFLFGLFQSFCLRTKPTICFWTISITFISYTATVLLDDLNFLFRRQPPFFLGDFNHFNLVYKFFFGQFQTLFSHAAPFFFGRLQL